MAWVKLDDQAPRNAKLLRAGPAAAWLWVCGIAHCQAHLSEGFIADVALPMIGVRGEERARKLAAVLVECALFDRVEGGYIVHDYLDFNETRDEALARKRSLAAKRAHAGRLGGLAKVANAKQTVVALSSPDPTRPDLNKNISLTLFVPKRDDCTYCGATEAQTGWALELDHVKPVSAGGTDEASNLVWACHPCNQAKKARVFTSVDAIRSWLHEAFWTSNRKRWIAHRAYAFGGKPPASLRARRDGIRSGFSCTHDPQCQTRHACIDKSLGRVAS